MGHRNPDRVPIAYRRSRCETVVDMLREGWDVISKCQECGLIMRLDLKLVIRVSGSNVTLWNRQARCRRFGCTGHVDFQARAPGEWHEALSAE